MSAVLLSACKSSREPCRLSVLLLVGTLPQLTSALCAMPSTSTLCPQHTCFYLACLCFESCSKANSDSLAASDAAIANARVNFGDVEIFEHQREKAAYLTKIGDKEGALKAYADINEPKLSSGQKIDISMAKARIAMAHSEWAIARERIVQAKA